MILFDASVLGGGEGREGFECAVEIRGRSKTHLFRYFGDGKIAFREKLGGNATAHAVAICYRRHFIKADKLTAELAFTQMKYFRKLGSFLMLAVV